MKPNAFKQTLKDIDIPTKKRPLPPMVEGIFPKPLQKYVGNDLNAIKWKNIGRGVRQAILKTDKHATARLIYIPAGTAMPNHGHNGLEMTLVLQGEFHDKEDFFARGDIEIGDENLHHTPTASGNGPCICLAASDAPLKFTSLLPRLLQPLFKI